MADKGVVDSLNRISEKLEDINSTLKDNKKKEESAVEEWKEQLEKLIKIVDSHCKEKLLTTRRLIGIIVMMGIFVAIFILLAYLNLTVGIGIISYAKTLPSEQQNAFLAGQLASYAALSTSIGAILLTLMQPNLFRPSSSEELAVHYYSKLAKDPNITTKDKPYLKALVKMKCNGFDLSLWEIYQNCISINSNLFSEESLLKNIVI